MFIFENIYDNIFCDIIVVDDINTSYLAGSSLLLLCVIVGGYRINTVTEIIMNCKRFSPHGCQTNLGLFFVSYELQWIVNVFRFHWTINCSHFRALRQVVFKRVNQGLPLFSLLRTLGSQPVLCYLCIVSMNCKCIQISLNCNLFHFRALSRQVVFKRVNQGLPLFSLLRTLRSRPVRLGHLSVKAGLMVSVQVVFSLGKRTI